MNRIRMSRLLIAGLATFVSFIAIELIWEGMIGTLVLGDTLNSLTNYPAESRWSLRHQALNLTIALGNCFMMIWLYASLRPMFGVGTRTALITSAFVFVFVFAFELNYANLGFFSFQMALIEGLNLIIELPLALIVGASMYESGRWVSAEA
jgi:hypothetical protein